MIGKLHLSAAPSIIGARIQGQAPVTTEVCLLRPGKEAGVPGPWELTEEGSLLSSLG